MPSPYRPASLTGQEGTFPSVADHPVSNGAAVDTEACVLGQNAPVRGLVEAIGDKWSLLCLYALHDGPVRFNALERRLEGISQKMLAQTLRKLERAGLVTRMVFAQVPPKVEYRLTELGLTLRPLADAMCAWSGDHGHYLRHEP